MWFLIYEMIHFRAFAQLFRVLLFLFYKNPVWVRALSTEAVISHDMLSAPMKSLEVLPIIFWEIIPKVAAG